MAGGVHFPLVLILLPDILKLQDINGDRLKIIQFRIVSNRSPDGALILRLTVDHNSPECH